MVELEGLRFDSDTGTIGVRSTGGGKEPAQFARKHLTRYQFLAKKEEGKE